MFYITCCCAINPLTIDTTRCYKFKKTCQSIWISNIWINFFFHNILNSGAYLANIFLLSQLLGKVPIQHFWKKTIESISFLPSFIQHLFKFFSGFFDRFNSRAFHNWFVWLLINTTIRNQNCINNGRGLWTTFKRFKYFNPRSILVD